MKKSIPALISLLPFFTLTVPISVLADSQWVYPGPDGKLEYKTTPAGDRIMDFSFAGYGGGGVKLPSVEVAQTISPPAGDASVVIQKAIDTVSELPLKDGFRGAVLLRPGTYECNSTITIKADGVVLRGSGPSATILKLVGKPHDSIEVEADAKIKTEGNPIAIEDTYVPAGGTVLHVKSASTLKVGDTIAIDHPVTASWIHYMGMDVLVRDGKHQTWLGAKSTITAMRKITAIDGNELTLDIPFSDDIDSKFVNPPGATVLKAKMEGEVSHVGIESLELISPPQSVTITEASFGGIHMSGSTDAWVKDVHIENTVGAVNIAAGCSRVTVEDVTIHHSTPTKGAAKPADLDCNATQVFFNRCSGDGDNVFYFATMGRDIGPIVLLNCSFKGNGHIQPHMRWSTGLLIDSCQCPDSGIDLMNRGIMGSGHGWTIGWSVAWNCVAKTFVIEQPPGSANWAIGCRGKMDIGTTPGDESKKPLPQGIVDSPDKPVTPGSLYLQQLKDRLGEEALHNIGY